MIFTVLSIIITIILTIPIYHISKWVLKKIKIGNSKSRKYIALLPSAILSLAFFLVIYYLTILSFIFIILNPSKKEMTFDANE